MKKIVITILFVLVLLPSLTLQAQTQSEYHHVGDTIVGRSPIYYYQWWSDVWLADTSKRLHASCIGPWIHGEYLQYNYTDEPLQIIGIATSAVMKRAGAYEDDLFDIPQPEYMRLYEASGGSFVMLKEVEYDWYTPRRKMKVPVRSGANELWTGIPYPCCYMTPDSNKYINIREYYFDKPVTVHDSFYIGYTIENLYTWTYNPHAEWSNPHAYRIAPVTYYWDTIIAKQVFSSQCTDFCQQTSFLHKFRDIWWSNGDTNQALSVWKWEESPYFTLIFPIIVIDSSYIIPPYQCPSVENFRLGDRGENNAILLWSTNAEHNSWQVSYGPAGTEPDDGSILHCPLPVTNITNLDTCTDYVAYIRAVCNHDSIVFSDWSEPLNFNICDTASSHGTGIPYGLDLYVNLIPNPADDYVQVVSSFEINAIEIVDSQGRHKLNKKANGHALSVDTRNWTAGVYFVVVHTVGGSFTKKLVIR
jgi:hypothetical protein